MPELQKTDPVLTDDQQLAALGLCMRDPAFYARSIPALKPEYFRHPIIRVLFEYVSKEYERRNGAVSTVALTSIIEQNQSDPQTISVYKGYANNAEAMSAMFSKGDITRLVAEQHKFMLIKGKAFELAKHYDKGDIDKIVETSAEIADLKNMRTTGVKSDQEAVDSIAAKTARWREVLKNRVPFITPAIEGTFMLTPGITLIGGVTKAGKSTIVANLAPAIIRHVPDKKILIISNEDDDHKVSARIACAACGVSIRDYLMFPQKIDPVKLAEVEQTMAWVATRVTVASVPDYDVTNMETVQDLLLEAKESGLYSAIMLDYYQIVSNSRRNKALAPVGVAKEFGLWLKSYAIDLSIPLIVFAQLKPQPPDSDMPFSQRIQGDMWLANHVHVGLEIRRGHGGPTDAAPITEVHCHLSRHGDNVGKIATFEFVHGQLRLTNW